MWHPTVVPPSVVNRIAAPSFVNRTAGDQSLPWVARNATARTRLCTSITVAVWPLVRRTSTSDEPQGASRQVAGSER